jgi:hypothetical protein
VTNANLKPGGRARPGGPASGRVGPGRARRPPLSGSPLNLAPAQPVPHLRLSAGACQPASECIRPGAQAHPVPLSLTETIVPRSPGWQAEGRPGGPATRRRTPSPDSEP